eukprot:TRINITY_DN75310_c0_g1_i1.p1 TRINITY_DN75310_c0_g1~~TRINITY_DN75310_c0_g1_i1.p1  ORF type:complete len:292 (-),score=60.77 TRINITY_DN75310_c0_g1_i1:61-936(-)
MERRRSSTGSAPRMRGRLCLLCIFCLSFLPLLPAMKRRQKEQLAQIQRTRMRKRAAVAAARSALVVEQARLREKFPDTICERYRDVKEGDCPKENKHNLCDDFPELCKNAKLPRCELPQLPEWYGRGQKPDEWLEWESKLKEKCIEFNVENITVDKLLRLRGLQSQLDGCKVCGMFFAEKRCFTGPSEQPRVPSADVCDRQADGCACLWSSGVAVLRASGSSAILDGHHRWAATRLLQDWLPEGLRQEFEDQPAVVIGYQTELKEILPAAKSSELVDYANCDVWEEERAEP